MVGTEAERGGIAKHSAKLVYAVANARVPRYTVIIGGSYGAGNYGMCGRGFEPRFLFSWPNARIATMSAEVAATVVTELRRASVTRGVADEAAIAELDRTTRAQFEAQSTPYYATARLWDDGIIEPEQTRDVLGLCLALASREAEPAAEPPRLPDVTRLDRFPPRRQPRRDRLPRHAHLPAARHTHDRRVLRCRPRRRARGRGRRGGRASARRRRARATCAPRRSWRPRPAAAPRRSTRATASCPSARSCARLCAAAGIVWVGPQASVHRAMGPKIGAKAIAARGRRARRAGLSRGRPVHRAAGGGRSAIGFPLMVKALGRGRRQGHAPGVAAGELAPRSSTSRGARRRRRSATRRCCWSAWCCGPGTSRCRWRATATARSCTCSSATAPCSATTRRCWRRRRRRTCRRGARAAAGARRARGGRDRLRQPRHGGVHPGAGRATSRGSWR